MGHVIVVGNEKGGAGKSTLSVHIAVACAISGLKVAALDLDRRQRTFERYFENRARWSKSNGADLPTPDFFFLGKAAAERRDEAEAEETSATQALIAQMRASHDIVIIDAPGADTPASRAAHACADTLVTPLNDSFIDFDLLAEIDPVTGDVGKPSVYAEMVWEARKLKAAQKGKPIDWVLMRNRLSPLDAKNKRRVGDALAALAQRIGFRVAPGLSERVIYREMFTAGLTLLDLTDEGAAASFTLSHVAARQELRDLMLALKLPKIKGTASIGF
ncbi:division plane positioning ATPase MipZ [Aquidulcibacter sp.]|uniref:division plane positioning ATPase MipZ n=1 Tax=Aquidulcibacter sp. TaxID=2052990 RepID=UPI0037BF9D85